MSPESRTLVVVLLLGAALASCCLCVPVVALIAVPAIARVQMAAEEVRAKQQAEQRALEQAMQQRPPLNAPPPPSPPRSPLPPSVPNGREIPLPAPASNDAATPMAELEPPINARPLRKATEKRRIAPNKKPSQGLAALSEFQRRSIYRSATVQERIESSLKQQIAERRQRGFDPAPLERMLKDRQSRQGADFDRLREVYQLSQEDFDKILAEGREKGW